MKQTDANYLTMVGVTEQMLAKNEAAWQSSEPAAEQIAIIRDLQKQLGVAQRGTATNTTGVTEDRDTAVDAATEEAILLSKAVRSYALKKKNMTLHNQFKISDRFLDQFTNTELVEYLKGMLERMKDIEPEVAKFDVTEARLTAFDALVSEADHQKSNTRTAIIERKGHNENIPQQIKAMKQAFGILDNLVASWVKTKADFVRDYFNARKVIHTGGGGGGGSKEEPAGDKPKT